MKVTIIAIGKIKNSPEQKLIENYTKQAPWIKIIEIDIPFKGCIELLKKQEAKEISKFIPKNSLIVALEVFGKEYSSKEFSDKFCDHANICFIIGGAYGIDADLSKSADHHISLSKMTLPHKLARLVLVEQIYRANAIRNNHPYNK